jgi:hypothetical protein
MIKVSVTVDDDHKSAMGEVAEALRSKGMEVEQVLDSVGIITGDTREDRRTDLESVAGVASVDQEMSFHVPPPDADVQ